MKLGSCKFEILFLLIINYLIAFPSSLARWRSGWVITAIILPKLAWLGSGCPGLARQVRLRGFGAVSILVEISIKLFRPEYRWMKKICIRFSESRHRPRTAGLLSASSTLMFMSVSGLLLLPFARSLAHTFLRWLVDLNNLNLQAATSLLGFLCGYNLFP